MERDKKLEIKLKNSNLQIKRYKKTFKWIKKKLNGLINFCESPYFEDIDLLNKTKEVSLELKNLEIEN